MNDVIRWSWLKRDFEGVVCYCAYREIGYAQYRLQHLLDLEQLITRRA